MRKLPVFRSVGEVFSGVTRHYFQLAALTWPAVVVLLAGTAYQYWALYQAGFYSVSERLTGSEPPAEVGAIYGAMFSAIPWAQFIPVFLISILASAVAAVRWHRFVLLGDGTSPLLRREDFRYLWTTVKVLFFLFLFLLVLGIVGGVVGTVVVLVAGAVLSTGQAGGEGGPLAAMGLASLVLIPLVTVGYVLMLGVMLRLMTALPDVAVGVDRGVIDSWRATSGNTWRMAGYGFLIYVPMIIVFAILEHLILGATEAVADNGGMAVAVITVLLGVALYLYFLMAQITMLSVAYREIVGLPGVAGGEAAPEPSVA